MGKFLDAIRSGGMVGATAGAVYAKGNTGTKPAVGASINKPSTRVHWPNPMEPNSTPWSLTNVLNNINKQGTPTSAGSSQTKSSLTSTVGNIINNKNKTNNSQAYYITHNEQGKPYGSILSEDEFKNNPVRRYYKGDYEAYKRAEQQKASTMRNAVNETNKQRRDAGLTGNWTVNDVRAHDMVLNNMAMSGQTITDQDQLGLSDKYASAALDLMDSTNPDEFKWNKWIQENKGAALEDNPAYKKAQKEAIDAYMSGTYFGSTWEKAKERNPLLTDEGLLEYFENTMPEVYYANRANSNDTEPLIKTMEQRANKAYALKRKQSPDYIAKDYDEYIDMVNQGLIAPAVKLDTTGKQVSIPYGTSKEDYNAYLQRKYADNGDDYYNRNYGELAKSDPNFWKGSPEAFDADGNPVDANTYLWLLNNPLTSALLQGMDASGNFSGAGPTMEQIARDPSAVGYGLYSERDVADMYASHILAGDEMGAMLESNPELMNAILTQAYTPIVDPKNPVTYDVPMIENPNGSKSRDPSKGVSGTLNLAEGYKTPAQLAAELIANPTSAEGMNNLQILAAVNALNNQDTTTPEKDKDKNKPSSGTGSGGSGGGGYGGGNMPAGGNPETTDTLYSMPEVGNYAARVILNKMLPTGYDYDYNKRLDKRLADIAAAEQNYKGNVLPSVERTYQDQAANTMANLVAALRANRASGLTSGASRGAQAASDVQAVQAASKENSEKLSKLINDNLAAFITQLASKRATVGNDTASELQGYASPMMTALGEVLAQYNYGSAAAQVNNGGLRRMQSYLV